MRDRWQTPAWVAAAWLPMLWWFAAFKPGLMSGDSLEIWRQATEGGWIDLQPPLYTAAMWLSDRLAGSPTVLTLGQSLLLAASLVAVGRALVRAGVDRRVAIGVGGAVAATPMVGAFSVSLWKDIAYTAALLFVVARLVDVARDPAGAGPAVRSIAAWSCLAVLLRQNGVLVVAPVLLLLGVVLRAHRRTVAGALLATIGVLGAAKLVAYPLLDVAPGPPHAEVSTFLHDVASVAGRDPGALDDADRALLERVAPVPAWGAAWQRFGCHSANWQYEPVFDWRGVAGVERDVFALWVELLVENPRAVIGNRSCVGAVAWRPDGTGTLYTVSRGIDPNGFGLATTPLVDSWNRAAVDVLDALDDTSVQWLAWRAPGWLYLAYAAVGVAAWRRRRPWLLLPFAVPVALQLSVAALNPAQDARYLMAGLLSAWLLLPLAAARPDAPTADP